MIPFGTMPLQGAHPHLLQRPQPSHKEAAAEAQQHGAATRADVVPVTQVGLSPLRSLQRPRAEAVGGLCGLGLPLLSRCCEAASDRGPPTLCTQCRRLCESFFDHACPACRASVCVSCVEDSGMVVASFRCPMCFEDSQNRSALQTKVSMLILWRSMKHAASAVTAAFGQQEQEAAPVRSASADAADPPLFAPPPLVPESSTRPLPEDLHHVALAEHHQQERAVPEYYTRLPLNWTEARPRMANNAPPEQLPLPPPTQCGLGGSGGGLPPPPPPPEQWRR